MSEKREFTLNDIPLKGGCLGMFSSARLTDDKDLPSVYEIPEKKRAYIPGNYKGSMTLTSARRPYEPPTIKSSPLSQDDNTTLGDDNAA